jgi:hypothetical protein
MSRAHAALFTVLTVAFAAIAVLSIAGGPTEPRHIVVAVAAAAIALWLGSLALRALRSR